MKGETALAVAEELLPIFLIQGCPTIIQSDNGREFCNNVIKELLTLWPEAKIVHGRPRHPQSQGSMKRGNQDIENLLAKYMRGKGPNRPKALPFIQHFKNNRYHSGIEGFASGFVIVWRSIFRFKISPRFEFFCFS